MKKVLIASDHAGFDGKEAVKKTLDEMGVQYEDVGTDSLDSVDYPDYAERVARDMASGEAELGILVCGSGIGMEIAANKVPGVRAALAWNEETARLARQHNDANIVAVGARTTPHETIDRIIRAFLTTDFEGGRHQRRIEKIKKLEGEAERNQMTMQKNHYSPLAETDPEIYAAIQNETRRQNEGLELIASENFVSDAVLEAAGSVFTNKYAEGYPGKRYYGGCEFTDVVESLAIGRAKQLFGAEHVNVQPHSGSQANMAVYLTACQHGDTILGMDLSHGGHLTHGHPLNFSGKSYKVVAYGVRRDDETIDYEQMERLAREHKPKLIVCGASAYSRVIDFERIAAIARGVGALVMADIAHIAGFVATGLHPSPVPHCDFVTTTTHKTLRGPRAGMIMCKEQFAKDLDRNLFPGIQGGPLVHIIAAKAVSFKEALQPEFKAYQQQILKNAKALAEAIGEAGFRIVSGGTDNHVFLVDVFSKGLTGRDAEKALEAALITVNKNTIPFDTNPPLKASGIRVGSPALTTRGMGEVEMRQVARMVVDVLRSPEDESARGRVQEQVKELTARYPLYANRLHP